MNRRRAIALAVIVALLLVALAALRWAAHPDTVGRLLLDRAGAALGLEISAESFEYRLRGTPEVIARGVQARVPGASTPLLHAERVLLSVPWSTIRARGAVLDIQRLELDAPVLDLPAFQRWWATRPPGDGVAPRFIDGIAIVRGRIDADGWRLDDLDIALPRFAVEAPLRAHVRGRYVASALQAPFDVRVAMVRASARSGIGVVGNAAPSTDGWRLPAWLQLSGRLHAGEGRIALERAALALRGRLHLDSAAHPLVAGAAGEMLIAGGGVRVEPLALVLRGEGVLPRLRSRGLLALQDDFALALAGEIAHWPEGWPTLPAPLERRDVPVPFALGYNGAPDLSAPLALRLERDGARFEGRLRIGAIGDWLEQLDRGTPLPPVVGTLRMPRLEIAGATLHGVEIHIQDEPIQGDHLQKGHLREDDLQDDQRAGDDPP